jgi:hypothetical protein
MRTHFRQRVDADGSSPYRSDCDPAMPAIRIRIHEVWGAISLPITQRVTKQARLDI